MHNETMRQKVLIVEDSDLFARLCGSLFKPLGCQVVHVRTQADALRLLERERPDLIVIDHPLPDGSGVEATRRIRACGDLRHTPIIAMTAQTSASEHEAIRNAGCTALVAKPLRLAEFSALARRYVSGRPA